MEELSNIILVDDNDREIGVKPRKPHVVYPQICRLSGLWMLSSTGSILISQRALSTGKNSGKLGPAVIGTVEVGQTYRTNIENEILEELGVRGLDLTESWKRPFSRDQPYFVQFFTTVFDKSPYYFDVPNKEVAKVMWYNPRELKQDVSDNPSKYLDAMSEYVAHFIR